jgi:hypothetical protein
MEPAGALAAETHAFVGVPPPATPGAPLPIGMDGQGAAGIWEKRAGVLARGLHGKVMIRRIGTSIDPMNQRRIGRFTARPRGHLAVTLDDWWRAGSRAL